MLLVDTSIWLEVFARPRRLDLTSIADIDDIVVCLPIVQEVLQGFRDERAYRLAKSAMLSFPCVESPLTEDVFIDAVDLYRSARRAGVTVRSGVDCLIAACAIRNHLELVHRDRDYDQLARVSPLVARRIR